MKRWVGLLLGVGGLVGCAGTLAPGVPSVGAAGALPSSTPAATMLAPSPYVPDPNATMPPLPYSPAEPCIGGEVRFFGKAEPGSRLVLWWRGEQALRPDGPPRDDEGALLDGAVRLGEVACDAQGAFELTVKLAPRLTDELGHALRLLPGKTYSVLRVAEGMRRPEGFAGVTLAKEACEPLPSAAPLQLGLEVADACGDRPAVIRGSGFGGPTATLVVRQKATRFGDGPQTSWEVPVDADGNVEYALRSEGGAVGDGSLSVEPGGVYFVRLFDHATQQWLEQPLTFCQGELSDALSAPSIDFSPGVILHSPQGEASGEENAVLRSAEELASFMRRHELGMPVSPPFSPDALRVDWESQQVVAVFLVPKPKEWGSYPEVVAISEDGAGYTVRTVKWNSMMPYPRVPRVHFLMMPRSDRPVTFAPLVEAFEDQRPSVPSSRKKPERWF